MFPQNNQRPPAHFQAPIPAPDALILAQRDGIALMITRAAAARGIGALRANVAVRRDRVCEQLARWCEQEGIALRWRLKINQLPLHRPVKILDSAEPATALATRLERKISALIDADFQAK
jgi:hypothetical protein